LPYFLEQIDDLHDERHGTGDLAFACLPLADRPNIPNPENVGHLHLRQAVLGSESP